MQRQTSRVARVVGPLSEYANGLRGELGRLGYTHGSAESQMRWVALLSRWMRAEHVAVGELDEQAISGCLACARARGVKRVRTAGSLAWVLSWLESEGALSCSPAGLSFPDTLLAEYCNWLGRVRGASPSTIRSYLYTARLALDSWPGTATGVDITARHVYEFVLSQSSRGLAPGTLHTRLAQLSAFLRFLHVEGGTTLDLTVAVPSVARWRDTTLPPTMTAGEVQALLDSCEITTTAGRRDVAILALLARLGLRASDVACLLLDDVDWRAGEIVLRGKGRHEDRLPLPVQVGEAMAAYLQRGRPQAECRNVFVTLRAPIRPLRPVTVSRVVLFACVRAGLPPARAHRLRHALGAELIGHGVKLNAIGAILRQRDLGVTAMYSKVDLGSLRQVAQPWPGSTR
jgi:integrase/recombinase XerD